MNFQQTLQKHLSSIKQRNLDEFLATVAEDEQITLIMPNGKLVRGYNDFAELNNAWFADQDWRLDFEIIRTVEAAQTAFAVVLVDYHDVDSHGQPFNKPYYLTLIFEQKEGSWLLTHDQNTFKD